MIQKRSHCCVNVKKSFRLRCLVAGYRDNPRLVLVDFLGEIVFFATLILTVPFPRDGFFDSLKVLEVAFSLLCKWCVFRYVLGNQQVYAKECCRCRVVETFHFFHGLFFLRIVVFAADPNASFGLPDPSSTLSYSGAAAPLKISAPGVTISFCHW